MNIATLYARRGQPGLEKLAQASDGEIQVPYLQRLLYVLTRRPSVQRANLLIKLSEQLWPGEGLTLDGLTNPEFYEAAIARELAEGRAHESFVRRAGSKARRLREPKPEADSR